MTVTNYYNVSLVGPFESDDSPESQARLAVLSALGATTSSDNTKRAFRDALTSPQIVVEVRPYIDSTSVYVRKNLFTLVLTKGYPAEAYDIDRRNGSRISAKAALARSIGKGGWSW